MQQRKPKTAHAQKRISFAVDRIACDWFVAAGIERAHRDRTPVGPTQNAAIRLVLLFLTCNIVRVAQHQLGADEADAIATRRIDRVELGAVGDVDQHLDTLSIRRGSGHFEIARGFRARDLGALLTRCEVHRRFIVR